MSGPIQRVQLADSSGNLYTSTNRIEASARLQDSQGNLYSATNPVPISGTMNATLVASGNRFFTKNTTGSTAFGNVANFGFSSMSIIIKNDGTDAIEFSFDGTTVHGSLEKNESLSMEQKAETNVYFRSNTIGQTFRIFAW